MPTNPDNWNEWKERCALRRCSEAAQSELTGFALRRFRTYLRSHAAHAYQRSRKIQAPAPHDCWHLFETGCTLRGTSKGKRYKDWLFARLAGSQDPPIRIIEGGATLLIRDVVREFIRAEMTPEDTRSLHTPISGRPGSVFSLEHLLPGGPDPSREAEWKDLETLAGDVAQRKAPGLSCRDKAALVARRWGLSLAHPLVEAAAGCKKSVLSQGYKQFASTLVADLQASYPGEDEPTLLHLALLTLRALPEIILSEKNPEKGLANLFTVVGRIRSEQEEALLATR